MIAVGSNAYGCMAYNMAVSLKLSSDVPIALLTDETSLDKLHDHQQTIFHQIIPNWEDYSENGKLNPLRLKTRIWDYTPFEETLYIDVDGLFMHGFKDIQNIFKDLGSFQIHEVKRHAKKDASKAGMIWTTDKSTKTQHLEEVWDFYNISEKNLYPEYNSSFIWFKKNKKNEKYFQRVRENYDKRFWKMGLGGLYPDELAWNSASAQMGHYVKQASWKPIYFQWEQQVAPATTIGNMHWFLGMAAGYQPGKLLSMYNGMARTNMRLYGQQWSRDFEFKMNNKLFFRA